MKLFKIALLLALFASCEKENENVIQLKSVNFNSKEILTLKYKDAKLSNFTTLKDFNSNLEYNYNYVLKYDVSYKVDGKIDKIILRSVDTVVYSAVTEYHLTQREITYEAVYSNSDKFCGYREYLSGTQMASFQYDNQGRVISLVFGQINQSFEYDTKGNMFKYSYLNGTRLVYAREYEFDTMKNPFQILFPIWGLLTVDWPPDYHYFASMSPNNPTRVQITGQPNEVINYTYQYNTNGYPSECKVSKYGYDNPVFTFTYY